MGVDHFVLSRVEQDDITKKLNTIAEWLAADLDTVVVRQTRYNDPSSDKVSSGKNRDTPLPYNETAAAAASEMHAVLRHWTEYVCTERRYPWPGEHRAAAYARWLSRHMIALSLCDDAQLAADDIHGIYTTARRLIDTPEAALYQGACQICGNDLWAKPSDHTITCRHCQIAFDRAANDEKINQALEARFYTVNELVDIIRDRMGVQIKPKTIHDMAYKRRQPLLVRGRTYDGQKLFRAGDVFTRIKARQEKSS